MKIIIKIILLLCIIHNYNCISNTVKNVISEKEGNIIGLANRVQAGWETRCDVVLECSCSNIAWGSLSTDSKCIRPDEPMNLANCGDCNGVMYDVEKSAVSFVGEVDDLVKEAVCFSRGLDPLFKEYVKGDYKSNVYYYGTTESVFRMYPGRSQSAPGYDPRVRPWYISAGSGPKDVVIILDTSGSMLTSNRIHLAKNAVDLLLQTFTPKDYVGVIDFNTESTYLGGVRELMRGTTDNLARLRADVCRLEASGGTQFDKAFDAAFNMLKNSKTSGKTSGCQSAIIFLTDGVDPSSTIQNTIKSKNTMEANVFSFSFGSGADTATTKKLACETDGTWSAVQDGNLRDQLALYYNYYSKSLHNRATELVNTVSWSAPYFGASTGVEMITASVPVFNNRTYPPELLGVVGTDIALDTLNTLETNLDELTEYLYYKDGGRDSVCASSKLTIEELQAVQGDLNCASVFAEEGEVVETPRKVKLSSVSQCLNHPDEEFLWCNAAIDSTQYREKICCPASLNGTETCNINKVNEIPLSAKQLLLQEACNGASSITLSIFSLLLITLTTLFA